MKIISSTAMRKDIAEIINEVKYTGQVFGVGRRNRIEAILMKYPSHINLRLDEITNINANSTSFEFLKDEPDLYSVKDIKKRHA
ncbi:MAG: hypothetical protein UW27_C0011G0009 [Parcubacteria group bacterium GW2011_GWA1_44_13]|uniref:Uncharacterized protein n=1 Tax=Candidatus Nomurabacteria bacterium GW2011_GWB1_44_12 TaxID=1618748 RepID=A0A837I9C3_9BACT|nr:MAG: hypothetical protein UW17_C0004G0004 [Candidatus Nomurabacteria bacterium GW2011_GWD1_44_10]KKT36452.1 MAG: hypothetical protein UW25_C0007G0009 [Candidatus Nomurabacteria bacterium GW2011_GWB1_44_12]KKT37687.1 MAG: hypothetical protein UW27_C0011G0009 [Parcubacteria group bacterium GW2011_GWA1_44_13]HBB44199.1 hypothetical protein [Candidatus Yonathbacteria bacterium]